MNERRATLKAAAIKGARFVEVAWPWAYGDPGGAERAAVAHSRRNCHLWLDFNPAYIVLRGEEAAKAQQAAERTAAGEVEAGENDSARVEAWIGEPRPCGGCLPRTR